MVLVSPSELVPLIGLSQYIAVDTEGTDIHKTDYRAGTGYAYGISIACRPVSDKQIYSAYYPVGHTKDNVPKEQFETVKTLIESVPRVVMHNAKHDLVALKTMGIVRKQFYCTMMMAHFLHENLPSKTLDWLAKFLLKDPGKLQSPEFNFWLAAVGWHPDFPVRVMAEYAAYDAEMTLRLFEKLYREFKKEGFDG